MPNWCNNQLVITGDYKERERFILATQTAIVDSVGDSKYEILDRLYPCPHELEETMSGGFGKNEDGTKRPEQIELERKQAENFAKYGAKDWYDWKNTNWGTKWGDCDTYNEDHDTDRTVFRFDSAWSPPIEGITHISTLFPTLSFVLIYEEGGMGYYGVATIENGEAIDNCENMEDIDGYCDIDYDNDEDAFEKQFELIANAKNRLTEGILG